MTGASGTPLAAKLGIREGATLALLNVPKGLQLELPSNVIVKRQAREQADVVLAFFARVAKLEQRLDLLGPVVFPSGALWIAWPKKNSGMVTDITDDAVRNVAIHRGLVDNRVCAVDATWTTLRLVWRRQHRLVAGQGR
jgi:hypothetical protein